MVEVFFVADLVVFDQLEPYNPPDARLIFAGDLAPPAIKITPLLFRQAAAFNDSLRASLCHRGLINMSAPCPAMTAVNTVNT